jgi:hypothetical protein
MQNNEVKEGAIGWSCSSDEGHKEYIQIFGGKPLKQSNQFGERITLR